MIAKGTAEELALNQAGQLAPSQRQQLAASPLFRMPALPGLLLGPLVLLLGLWRGGAWVWLGLALGLIMLLTGLSRLRQRRLLGAMRVEPLEGVLQHVEPAPIRFIEALLTVDRQQLALPAGLPGAALEPGRRYRFYVVRGIARRPVVVAAETVDSL